MKPLTTQEKLVRLTLPVKVNPHFKAFKLYFNKRKGLWQAGFVHIPPFPHTICPEEHDAFYKECFSEHADFDQAVQGVYRQYVQKMKKINGTEVIKHTKDCELGQNYYDCPACRWEAIE